jgi:hypothetical protein
VRPTPAQTLIASPQTPRSITRSTAVSTSSMSTKSRSALSGPILTRQGAGPAAAATAARRRKAANTCSPCGCGATTLKMRSAATPKPSRRAAANAAVSAACLERP